MHGGVYGGEDFEGGGFGGEDEVGGDDAVGPAFEGAGGEGGWGAGGGGGEEVGDGWGGGWWGERMMVVDGIDCSERFRAIEKLVVVDWECDGGNAECQEHVTKDKDNDFRRVRILHVGVVSCGPGRIFLLMRPNAPTERLCFSHHHGYVFDKT